MQIPKREILRMKTKLKLLISRKRVRMKTFMPFLGCLMKLKVKEVVREKKFKKTYFSIRTPSNVNFSKTASKINKISE